MVRKNIQQDVKQAVKSRIFFFYHKNYETLELFAYDANKWMEYWDSGGFWKNLERNRRRYHKKETLSGILEVFFRNPSFFFPGNCLLK